MNTFIERLTSILLRFFCQCSSCCCCDRLGGKGRPSLWRTPLLLTPTDKSFSWRLLQSSGLHNPKSDNFMWPFLSSSKLSGLISLQNAIRNQNIKHFLINKNTSVRSVFKIHAIKLSMPIADNWK